MPVQPVPINPAVLSWAIAESGLTLDDVAARVKVDRSALALWMQGEAEPTKGQFTKLVDALKRPSAVFFLPEPPVRAGIPTSFRRAPGLDDHTLSKDEVHQIRWARRLQRFISWSKSSLEDPPVELERLDRTSFDPSEAGARWREISQVSLGDQLQWGTANEAFRVWRRMLEDMGVLVFQLSLGRKGLRGFSAWDDFAPLVTVSTSYHPTARVYSLFHEFGHLLTRTDSACLRFVAPKVRNDKTERWCEQFAASFLLPADPFRDFVASAYRVRAGAPVVDPNTARLIANRVSVSTRAVAIRLEELGLGAEGLYGAVAKQFAHLDWNDQSGGGGGGMSAPEKRLSQLGGLAPETLISAASQGVVTERELTDYLRLTMNQVSDLEHLVGVHSG